MCAETHSCFGCNTVRLMVSRGNHGYCYFVNVSGREWLDVARGLWCMGVDDIMAYGTHGGSCWVFRLPCTIGADKADRRMAAKCKGGYSGDSDSCVVCHTTEDLHFIGGRSVCGKHAGKLFQY